MQTIPKLSIELFSPRLILQGLNADDLQDWLTNTSKEEIIEFMGCDESSYLRYKEMNLQGLKSYRHTQFLFLIREISSRHCIGEAGFHSWNPFHCRAELFYLLREESSRNKGIMSEALPLILDYGFHTLHLNRIQALVAGNNLASLRLLQKSGFRLEGTNRQDYRVEEKFEDSIQYSLLAQDWLNRS